VQLSGRAALVTGGSGDLGTAICRALAAAGCDVAVGYVGNREGAETTCRLVQGLGRAAAMVQLDQADPAAIEPAVAAAERALGRLDVLVNNAAWNIGIPFPALDQLTADIWDRIHDTNVRGPYLLARAAAGPMRRRGGGRIVNIASIAGLRPSGSSIAYATSKAALIHLTRCLAVALAPDITVNCVAPGLIEGTRMARRLPPEVAQSARDLAVLRRASGIEDIAEQVVTFCRADSVTGQTVVVDGGVHFH
jgi:3-oxoacyl-[acyl-carrier protein] reductase